MKTDNDLRQDVLDQLKFEPGVDSDHVLVSVIDGIVTLKGFVPTYAEKVAAERAVEKVSGVLALADDIMVKLPSAHKRSDADVSATALNAIRCITTVPTDSIKISARNGWLILEGMVENWYQREAAVNVVRHLTGVVGVTNLISIKPGQLTPEVTNAIEAAFERHALLDAENIKVDIDGTKISLHGSVSSLVERAEAERAAWSAPGVSAVENQITVAP